MLLFVLSLLLLVLLPLSILHLIWRSRQRQARRNWQALYTIDPGRPPAFDPASIRDLPEPVQRFFLHTIKPGTPLYQSAEIMLRGEFSFGPRENSSGTSVSNYQALLARQVLRAGTGMIWEAKIGSGLTLWQGSDGLIDEYSWTQFAWRNLFPVALIQRNRDHYRSAAGRMLAESAFWTPTVLLTLPGVRWEAHDAQSIVATISHRHLTVSVTLKLNGQGQPIDVSFLRWSNANADKIYRLQPFGGYLSDFREFDGVMIPTQIEAGNFFGTADYFPFYKVQVEQLRWIDAPNIN